MRIIRRTNILVKTKRAFVTSPRNDGEVILCPQCGECMSEARRAAAILDKTVREVYRLVEAGRIHFFETDEKIGFMCLKSVRSDLEIH